MDFIRHPKANKDWGAPPPDQWDQSKLSCGTLPSITGPDPQTGGITVRSHWKPTPRELALLNDGGAVEVILYTGGGMCPISVVTTPKEDLS